MREAKAPWARRPNEAICYLQPAAHEICVGGRKLIGSAQLRRRGVLLQHGSLPLGADIMAIADALVYENEAARAAAKEELRRGACSLAEVLGGSAPGWAEAAAAMAAGFADAFEIRWEERGVERRGGSARAGARGGLLWRRGLDGAAVK